MNSRISNDGKVCLSKNVQIDSIYHNTNPNSCYIHRQGT